MSHGHANATTPPLQQALADSLELHTFPPIAIDFILLSLSSIALAWLVLPRALDFRQSSADSRGAMSLAVVGAVILALCAMAYALSICAGTEEGLPDPKKFQARKDLYRKRRDDFRNNREAMEELEEWKAMKNDCDYPELGTGLIPTKLVGKKVGEKAFAKSDTWFSEFELHNNKSMILSESPFSYIIGNLHSYDQRQYPPWFDPNVELGRSTPAGQGFGHTLVISRKRVFNVIDPDATANESELLKEMKAHFISLWETENGITKLLKRTKLAFDDQNNKLASKECTLDKYQKLLPRWRSDYESLAKGFQKCKPEDFEFAFHAHPDNSVGHLHMHVFPKKWSLRKFSSKQHDWKTIPLKAILEVEEEDKRRRAEGVQAGQ